MKERGILFNTEMVKATLEDRKTNTRRVVKHNLIHYIEQKLPIKCPYGQVGDHLYVRETWCYGHIEPVNDDGISQSYYIDQAEPQEKSKNTVIYKADVVGYYYEDDELDPTIWKPSIHMPKKYSRITLEITDIRVERVQDISENDAKKEGVKPFTQLSRIFFYTEGFHLLWDSINKKRGYGWDKNPYVWVVEFKRVSK